MERGTNGCSWFNVLDYESSSNSDFLRWMKSSGAGSEVSIMAAHHQQTIPFLPVDGGGGAGKTCRSSIYLDQVTSCYGGGGGGGGGFPFTNSQRKELERQATIYKCMISSVPVPHHLLFPLDSPVSSGYGGQYSRKGDLEPGRCKRTDGKKWRCSREVAPLQKYCDRHLHRGRPRSRKPVELNKKTRLHQNKPPPSASTAIEAPLPSKTDLLAISTPYYKETANRDLDSKQPWQNLMESDYRSSFDQDFTAQQQQQQPLNLLFYPNLPSGFIDAWSIENLNSRSVESSIRSSEGDLSPSLNLSMAMAVGEVLDEQMRNIQTEAPAKIEKQAIWWEGGGPLGEALQQGASTPASPSGVLHRTLFSHSDGSACNSPTLAPEIPNHWNFFP